MIWLPRWARRAERDLDNLDRVVRNRIEVAILHYAETGQGDLIPLRGRLAGEWRLRVGDWRVRLEFDENENAMHILRIQHRREVYRQ